MSNGIERRSQYQEVSSVVLLPVTRSLGTLFPVMVLRLRVRSKASVAGGITLILHVSPPPLPSQD